MGVLAVLFLPIACVAALTGEDEQPATPATVEQPATASTLLEAPAPASEADTVADEAAGALAADEVVAATEAGDTADYAATVLTEEEAEPEPIAQPEPAEDEYAYYANCTAARAAGAAPVHSDDPGYSRKLDRDGDGIGCE